jgi:hypothetical protein
VCAGFNTSRPPGSLGPFDRSAVSGLACFSSRTPDVQGGVTDYGPFPPGTVGVVSTASFPVLLAAVDPTQEEHLVDLKRAVVSGRMLRPGEAPTIERKARNAKYRVVHLLASTRTYVDERLRVTVERLAAPRGPALSRRLSSERSAYHFVTSLRGRVVGRETFPIAPFYRRLIDGMMVSPRKLEISYSGFWTASPVRYRQLARDRLEAIPAKNDTFNTFQTFYGPGWAPQENRDVKFRRLASHQSSPTFVSGILSTPALRVIGRFDPDRLPGFSPLSAVPLETYYPPVAEPADGSSRQALHGHPLRLTQNIGGYLAQPPLLLTTLRGLKVFTNSEYFQGVSPKAPISVIRVRVAGVTGPDPLSRERIRLVAEAIHDRTGLAVDVTAGSSPHPILVRLPRGRFGAPSLLVREGWVEKGVSVRFLQALDRKSLGLFALTLVVCAFFLANGALASVRARRAEIGTLLCLGWSRVKVFEATLSEVALVGAVAGLVGTALAAVMATSLSLRMPVARAPCLWRRLPSSSLWWPAWCPHGRRLVHSHSTPSDRPFLRGQGLGSFGGSRGWR